MITFSKSGVQLDSFPVSVAACSTAGGGWLSGWPASSLPRHPLNTYDTPGTLPSVAEGVVDGTVCFDVGDGSGRDASIGEAGLVGAGGAAAGRQ